MPGKRITKKQEKIYMSSRQAGLTQRVSAAKADISERSGRILEKEPNKKHKAHYWRTRLDPFEAVWERELVPLLEKAPELTAITLLEHLQSFAPKLYPDKLLRTLQRRVKQWKAVYGKEKLVIFRQEHPPGRLGLSDFTTLKNVTITIKGKPLEHILYHFRLACSGWSHVKAILGGESFTALAEGLQEALWRLGGCPEFHRTDSLAAAYKNLTSDEKVDLTTRYEQLCQDYQMQPCRNNKGQSHENGSIESPHGHIKRRIKQALLLRQSTDFDSLTDYNNWLNDVVHQHNQRYAKGLAGERPYLNALPRHKSADYTEVCARVTSASTIDVRRVTYTVPSRLVGERLRIWLYHDRLVCYVGSILVLTLPRIYPKGKTQRARRINYEHVVDSLIKKPGAFRYSRLRDDILPNDDYRCIWQYLEANHAKSACEYIVNCLYLAAKYHCEKTLAQVVLTSIAQKKLPPLSKLREQFCDIPNVSLSPQVTLQPSLASYNVLVDAPSEVHYA